MVLEEYQTNAQGKYRLNAVPASILFSAKTPEALAKLLAKWQTKLNVNVAEQVFTFNTLVTEHPVKQLAVDDARCGFVADNAEQALALITSAIKQLASSADAPSNPWQVPSGIYYRPCGIEAAGKVVALFSGQGSQYLNMGRELVCNFPCMMQAASNMDSQFTSQGLTQLSQVSYPIPAFTSEDKKRQEEEKRR